MTWLVIRCDCGHPPESHGNGTSCLAMDCQCAIYRPDPTQPPPSRRDE